jgi:hypothetical protein
MAEHQDLAVLGRLPAGASKAIQLRTRRRIKWSRRAVTVRILPESRLQYEAPRSSQSGTPGWTGYGTRVLRTRRPSPRRTHCSRRVSTRRTSSAIGPTLLVREDTGQLLAGQDLAPDGDPQSFFVWDREGAGPAAYRVDGGYGQDGVEPALSGTYRMRRRARARATR